MEVCKLLLDKNAFVNSKTKKGLTALHYAAQKGHVELVQYLIKDYHAEIESRNSEKQTPLHLAAKYGQIETCKVMFKMIIKQIRYYVLLCYLIGFSESGCIG